MKILFIQRNFKNHWILYGEPIKIVNLLIYILYFK